MQKPPSLSHQIVFFPTHDIQSTRKFYENILGLTIALDQGDCRIYQTTPASFIGFCERLNPQEPSRVIITLVTEDVDAWYQFLLSKDYLIESPPKTNPKYNIYHFFLRDPNGYLIEIQKFNHPFGD